MINGEYGRSAIKLIFTILILAVVITGIVFMAEKLWKDNSVTDIETDLLSIKAKCKDIHDKNIIDENTQLLGENITEYPENEEVNEIISGSGKWYKLSQDDLEAIGVGNLKAKDGYLVNYEENDVIYAKGIEKDGQLYYKLSDIQNIELEKEVDSNSSDEQPVQGEEEPPQDMIQDVQNPEIPPIEGAIE